MINPRRLKGTAANLTRYYMVGDYYTKGGDEHSEWGGAIARDLGIAGEKVDPSLFKEMLAGSINGQQLGRHRKNGEIEHHPGWDFAVNAPKSVSVIALVSGDERIVAAHEKAVGTALGYLEEHATLRRRDGGEIVHETTGRLIFARFTERASRELDPHLHTHVVVMNMTNRREGAPMASLETRAMFAEQMVAGQIYRNDLAHRLREIGYEVEADPRTGLFEMRGVPADLIRSFSQRAEQIDTHANEHGLTGQAARQEAFYATRGPKVKTSIDALRRQWTERSQAHRPALDGVRADADLRGEAALSPDRAMVARAALFGVRQAEAREAVNNAGRMLHLGLASHVGEVRLGDIRPIFDEHEQRRKLLATRAPTGDQTHTRGRTTRRTARLEQALARHLALALADARPVSSGDRLIFALEQAGLTPAQEQALAHVALSRDRVIGIHGVAGAGKSMLVATLDKAAEPGTTLLAIAPTSSATANLGQTAGIESRTVASLLAGGGHGITDRHVLVLDEAGQLGSRQALRLLEISRASGARLILLGDNRQTGAIEQGKAFWLLQQMGMSTSQLGESMRQQTKTMKSAVTKARTGDYAGSLASLDKVVSGAGADRLARVLVGDWTRLKPESRDKTNILVLDNATRLVVNGQIRETLKREGVVAAEDTRLQVLTSSGMSEEEKRNARFYSGGQVVSFGRDVAALGIARNAEYRVLGLGRDSNGRQVVRLVDETGRMIRWDPRLGSARQVNVFNREERDLAEGDRIQWRLANAELQRKNAERGTVIRLSGDLAAIRWDRDGSVQDVDLGRHRTWDYGYAETVYSSQSKTYDRVYILAPVNSALVNGQNYYTAITRARFGARLWTEDEKKLANRLVHRSGEKTSALEGLGRLGRDHKSAVASRHRGSLVESRDLQERERQLRRDDLLDQHLRNRPQNGAAVRLASGAQQLAHTLDVYLQAVVDRARHTIAERTGIDRSPDRASAGPAPTTERER
jgi:conjugative relaxase-like TrwC/TraI family protein